MNKTNATEGRDSDSSFRFQEGGPAAETALSHPSRPFIAKRWILCRTECKNLPPVTKTSMKKRQREIRRFRQLEFKETLNHGWHG